MAAVLILGGGGMLGRTLARRFGARAIALGRAACDIEDAAAIEGAIAAHRPRAVINCAAMTAVDACETQRDRAFALNADAAGGVATACARAGVRLVHLSTDYVFPGTLDRPYREDDATGPRTAYGQSKLAGEDAVRAAGGDHLVARVAWLYGPGGPSFVHAMARLAAQDGPPVTVVADQRGNPTSTDAVAAHLALLVEHPLRGVVHLTCEGETTWFGFASDLFALKGWKRGVTPCTTAQFARPAPRPVNSSLDKAVLRAHALPPMPRWEDALRAFVREFPDG